MKLVNLELLKQPWNWAVIALFALFWLIFLAVVFPVTNATGELQNGQGS